MRARVVCAKCGNAARDEQMQTCFCDEGDEAEEQQHHVKCARTQMFAWMPPRRCAPNGNMRLCGEFFLNESMSMLMFALNQNMSLLDSS
jgi:hypothetical protein